MSIVKSLPKSVNLKDLIGSGCVVTFLSCRYFYVGEVSGISDDGKWIEIEGKRGAHFVYETGNFTEEAFADAQSLWKDASFTRKAWRIATDGIESYGVLDKEFGNPKKK